MSEVLTELYEGLSVKKPIEMDDYQENSKMAIDQIDKIIQNRISSGNNEIVVDVGLKRGIPMTNIHRIAAPIVEQWANEVFEEELENEKYDLVGVEVAEGRLDIVDVVLSFKRKNKDGFNAQVDVKATSGDIETSGKSPNITSFVKIRSAYINDPDFMFVILSLKHSVYSDTTGEKVKQYLVVKQANTYDLKNISEKDFNINPALGTGQLQIRDIHYVNTEHRTTWEFCQLLDRKFMNAEINTKDRWIKYARKNEWIK